MAFDHPLEADKVDDDLNLFSVLRRAPVLGTILWILGGDAEKQREEEEQKIKLESELYADDSLRNDKFLSSNYDSYPSLSSSSNQQSEKKPLHLIHRYSDNNNRKGDLKKMPKLLGSDLSDFHECAEQEEKENEMIFKEQQEKRNYDIQCSMSSLASTKKTMSWSDEAGRNLVEYAEESTSRHGASSIMSSTSAFSAKPVKTNTPLKSALKRSKSMRNDQLRYIPKGLDGGHNGLIMPTYYQRSKSNGYISPEYGFYINITPTSPETPSCEKGDGESHDVQRLGNEGVSQPSTILTNPAFSNRGRPKVMNWPSVPL